jgi:hypothetical protein
LQRVGEAITFEATMKRDSAAIIFRTVVFAGAMLGTPACSKKPAANTPKAPMAEPAKTPDPAMMQGETAKKPDAADESDPCAGGERPRGGSDEGGETGRGFILS